MHDLLNNITSNKNVCLRFWPPSPSTSKLVVPKSVLKLEHFSLKHLQYEIEPKVVKNTVLMLSKTSKSKNIINVSSKKASFKGSRRPYIFYISLYFKSSLFFSIFS